MEKLYENFKKYAKKAYKQVEPLVPFSNANQYAFNPRSELYNNSQALDIQNDTDILNQQMANYRANQNGTFMLNALTKSDEQKRKDSIDFDNKFIDLATAKGYTPHKAIDKDGKARYAIEKDGVLKEIEPSFLNDLKANSYEMLGSLAGVAAALPHPLAKTAGVAGKVLTPMVGSAVGSGAGAMADTYLNNKSVGENTTAEQLANSFTGGANNDILGAGLATAITSKPAINTLKGTLKAPLEVLDKGLTGVGARHILSQNIGGAETALKANLGGDHEFKNALDSAKDALGADLDNFVSKGVKTINKTSDNRYIQKGIDIANSAINKANETLKGLNVGKADAELLLSALGHENGVKNILDAVANNPQSAQKITEISSNLNKSFSDSINEQLAKFKTQTPKDSFKNSFNQVKQDYADTKDFLVKNSNYQSDFKDLNDNLATILSDTQNINTRGVFNALNGGDNLENLLNAKNAINEQLSYIMRADFKSSSDFINQKALNEAKSLIDNEINTALKNDENLINLYKSANGDYATMKNIVDSNLMNQISRDGKTSLEALNAMIKSNENINGVTLNEFLSSLGAKDRAIAEANIIKGLMEKNSVNGVVDFRALNQSLNSLDFGSEFAKELKSQILNRQALLNNTSDILNALGNKVVKSKNMSQGISTDPLKRAETMKANFIVDKLKPLIPRLGNNEALKLHLNRAILNANGDFKLAIKNIDNIPDGNLPTPTRNLLNEFKKAVKEIEKQVVKNNSDDVPPSGGAGVVNGNIDSLTQQITYLQNALKNQSKDAPPSTATKEADNLSETTPNLTQNIIKGDGFVISGNGVEPKSDLSVKISVDEWVKELAGINPNKQIIADLEHLYEKHKELFSKPSEVFKLIKAVKDNPTFFYTNNQPNIALIGSILENGKLGKIGIQKDFDSDNLQVRHATYSSNAKKENERLLKRNSYPVGSPTPTQLTFGKTAEPTANGAKALLGKKDGAIAGTPAPATTRPNNGVEGEIIKNRTNAQTIPNQTIKEAETTAKELIESMKATPMEQWSKEQKEFFDNLPKYKQNEILDALKIKHDEEVFGKIPYNELSDRNQSKVIDEVRKSAKGKELQAQYDKLEVAKYTAGEGGKYPSGAQLAKITKAQNKITAQRDELINTYIKEYDEKVARNSKIPSGEAVKAEPIATAAKDLTADAPSELYKAHRKAQKAKEAPKPQEPTAEPTPQAKADEVDINPKSNYKKHERPIELDFQEAIDKGFNVDINALKHFYKNSGNSPLNYMREYMAELDQIEKKALGNEAKDRLKALYENFFYSVKAVERHKPNQIEEYSSIGGQKEFEKIKEFRNEIEKAPTNQKALDALEKIEFVNNLENSPTFKLAKRQKTMKKEFVKEARNALKQATNLALKPLSQFLIKYGKSEEFLTKSSIISKIELENARGLRELKLNIRPIKEFGTNYAEFYHDGANAIKKLLTEREGQVAGAFHKDGRDITISWGEAKMANGDIKGYGLSKIEAKHLNDFAIFEGSTPQEKMANGINEIIEKGKIVSDSGIDTIWYKKGDSYFLVGLSKGFKGIGDNSWVVTSYKKTNISENKKAEINEVLNGSGNSKTLSAYAEIKSSKTPELTTAENSTPKTTKSQAQVEQKAKQYAKWLSQADKIPPQAPDELYKAYDKAKRT